MHCDIITAHIMTCYCALTAITVMVWLNLLICYQFFVTSLSPTPEPRPTQNPRVTEFDLFVARQKLVNSHIEHRRAWECQGICEECTSEYKALHSRPWKNSTNLDKCPIECDMSGLSVDTTMENTGCWKGDSTKICGNTRRSSDVHMQYYSWAEIDFMRPAQSLSSRSSFIASFISNCAGGDRLTWMASLKRELANQNETRVFNYGGCNRDTEEPEIASVGRGRSKDVLAQASRFVFSFENSQTEDYVTEKLFDMLSSGTLPVYRGATNARVYAPSNKSVIFASEYQTPHELADALLAINQSEYENYMQWKQKGPDLKWITLIDESIVHSQCRMCMLAAEHELSPDMRWWVRERGQFHYVGIQDTFETMYDLQYWISERFIDESKPHSSGAVVDLYVSLDRNRCSLSSLDDLRRLKQGEKLEVVLENPGWRKREHFVQWWEASGRPLGY